MDNSPPWLLNFGSADNDPRASLRTRPLQAQPVTLVGIGNRKQKCSQNDETEHPPAAVERGGIKQEHLITVAAINRIACQRSSADLRTKPNHISPAP